MSASTTFFDVLLRCEIGLWNRVDRAVQRDRGLSLGRLQALRVLDVRGGKGRVQDLADDLVITVGATSKLVDRLEADGTVRREPNPDDRRSSLVVLTAAGREVLDGGAATMDSVLADALSAGVLDDAELTGATAVLRRVLEHLAAKDAAGVGA